MPDIIFLSLENWDEIWRRNQFVCATLARRHPQMKILFVGLPRHAAQHIRAGNLRPLLANPTQPVPEYPNITFTTPLRVAPDKTHWGLAINQSLYRRHVIKTARTLGLQNPILWINPHNAYHLANRIPHSGLIYDITDDWISLTQKNLDRNRTIAADEFLCRRADASIVCSEKLRQLKEPVVPAGRLHLVKNGVDADHYAGVLQPGAIPENLAHLPRPIYGYTGTLHPDRLDLDLLARTAALVPGSFALIGPSYMNNAERRALEVTGKVHILPPVPYHDIPGAMRAFDVAITPHRLTPFTESLNPIKLFEYLAAGKPIVSTPVAGFRDYPNVVRLATTPEQFAQALNAAAKESQSPGAPAQIAARQTEARKHSWESRVEQIESIVGCVGQTRRVAAALKNAPPATVPTAAFPQL